jgi:twitching motility protein PilT
MTLAEMLAEVIHQNGSDLHLVAGSKPTIRINGQLDVLRAPGENAAIVRPLSALDNADVLGRSDVQKLFAPHLSERQIANIDARVDVVTSIVIDSAVSPQYGEACRFRACIFWDCNGVSASLRVIPTKIPTLTDLFHDGAEPIFRRITNLRRGLVLTVGITGSGKSTTTAAMVDTINAERAERIFTIEDPIEYLYTPKLSLISQRNVGTDVESYEQGGLSALQSDPDVVVIGEFRTPEAVRIALALADTGHLVFATMHADSVSEAIRRLYESFPDNRESMQRLMARGLAAVIAQRLVHRASGVGRAPVNEIMLVNSKIRQMLQDGDTDFTLAIEAGRSEGMQTMDDSVMQLYSAGVITYEKAWEIIDDRDRLGPRPQ